MGTTVAILARTLIMAIQMRAIQTMAALPTLLPVTQTVTPHTSVMLEEQILLQVTITQTEAQTMLQPNQLLTPDTALMLEIQCFLHPMTTQDTAILVVTAVCMVLVLPILTLVPQLTTQMLDT